MTVHTPKYRLHKASRQAQETLDPLDIVGVPAERGTVKAEVLQTAVGKMPEGNLGHGPVIRSERSQPEIRKRAPQINRRNSEAEHDTRHPAGINPCQDPVAAPFLEPCGRRLVES